MTHIYNSMPPATPLNTLQEMGPENHFMQWGGSAVHEVAALIGPPLRGVPIALQPATDSVHIVISQAVSSAAGVNRSLCMRHQCFSTQGAGGMPARGGGPHRCLHGGTAWRPALCSRDRGVRLPRSCAFVSNAISVHADPVVQHPCALLITERHVVSSQYCMVLLVVQKGHLVLHGASGCAAGTSI